MRLPMERMDLLRRQMHLPSERMDFPRQSRANGANRFNPRLEMAMILVK
jgi:hypothetical protein